MRRPLDAIDPSAADETGAGSRAGRLCGYRHRLEDGSEEWCCPAADQSGEEVAAWLRSQGSPSQAVVVFFRQQALCQFRLDEISAWRGDRVHLVEHGAFDAHGFSVIRLKHIHLRIVMPSAPVVAAATRGVTLQHCNLVNKRALSPQEEVLARRMLEKVALESRSLTKIKENRDHQT